MKNKEMYLPDVIGKGYASFWKSKDFFRVVKGGRASKKSTTTAMWYIYKIMEYELANAVVVRQVYSTHKNSTFAELKKAAKRLNVYNLWKFTENPLQATYLKTGQKILFYGFDDPMKLTSMNVDTGYLCWAWFEEVFEIDNEEDFNTFVEGIRGAVPYPLFKQVTLTYNPWVNGHWTKPRFWDGECPPDTFRDTTTHKCNEFLDDADHKRIEDLAKTDPERYKVVGMGDYGIPGGSYFDEFRTDIHIVEPFIIPDYWRRYIALDYGLDMLAAYWVAVDNNQKAYVYKELYQDGLIISNAAKRIKEVSGNDKIYQRLAPPDLWNRRQETGKSAADLFRENGVILVKANNNRVQGWYNLKEWLKPYEDEQGILTASLVIFKNCVNLIRCLPQLQRDEKDPNDVATEPHELTHGPDAIRYFIAGRPKPNAKISDNRRPDPNDPTKFNFNAEQPQGIRVTEGFFKGGWE
jgi:phage terminase large subunit